MATWKAINSLWSTRDPSIQARIDQAFRAEWCHLGIFGVDCATIVCCFLAPCISWISLMFDGAVASLPFWGFRLALKAGNPVGTLETWQGKAAESPGIVHIGEAG
jgi:hypothetical protein